MILFSEQQDHDLRSGTQSIWTDDLSPLRSQRIAATASVFGPVAQFRRYDPFTKSELAEIDRYAQEGGLNLWKKPSTADQRI